MEYDYTYQYYLHFKEHVSLEDVLAAFTDFPDTLVEPVFDSSFSIMSNSSFSRVKHLIRTNWPESALMLVLAKRTSLRYRPDEPDLLDGCVKV